MSGTTNSGRVPRLRFPEFREAEGWKQKTLSGIAMVVMGSSPRSEGYNESQNGLPLLQGNADIKNRLSAPRVFTSEITKECQIGDILMSVRAPVGSVAKSVHHACIGRGIAAIHSRRPNSQEFLYQWLLSYESRWVKISQGGTFDAINSDDLRQVRLTTPSPAEQQNIADCLSSVDELLAAQTRKVDALKAHKKGLMQQLFPREGETQPRLRFPEFKNTGEWVLKKLEEVSPSVFDGTHQTPTYTPEGVPFYSVENLISGNANKFISRANYLLATKNNKPEIGDILITRIGKIGHSQVVTWDHEFSVYVTLAVIKKSKAFNSHFLSHFMQSDFYQSELRARSLPNAVPPKINLDSLRSTEVLLTNEAEQQRIALCLTSLDDLITAQTQKLEALKTHKKGLMQQLFPQVSEE
ncbi:restriction endonuclease subunit S [Acidithiobacillus ferridurans]|uniref:restriction endonuclease subunit S n=1 Tax=Acidithiobacillus ferridurans TaxID=1232575 RepID=UPI000DE2F5EA|nr:restriction endonuclease subunit S [Acidithiobacillus ferridurans]RBM03670.1 restriction endonuclease subunit S [Acidithiobacillus ferridurans]